MRRFFLFIPFIFFLQCSLPEPSDTLPPVSAVVFPYEGAVISTNVEVNIQTSDDSGIDKVWYYIDGLKIEEKTKSPFTFTLDISPLTKKVNHVMQAAAQDKDGNIGYSALVNFTVAETEDIIPPTVVIVNPQSGQVVEGVVHVTAHAEDERSIQKVAFFVDGDSLGVKASYPYIFNWHTDTLSDSTAHTIFVKAFDTGNNTAISPTVTVTVYPRSGPAGDNTPPEAFFLYPITGTTISGTVKVALDLKDNVAVTNGEFYVDGQLQHSQANPGAPWAFDWDTEALADGEMHALYAKVFDAAGNMGTSSINVIINPDTIVQTDDEAPAAAILFPVNASTISGTVSVSVDLADNIGVSKAEFYVDGQLENSQTNPSIPWVFNWDSSAKADSASHSLYVKAYDAVGNVGTSGLLVVIIE